MIFGDGSYLLLLRTVVIIGVVVVMLTSVIKGGLPELKGFFLVIFVYIENKGDDVREEYWLAIRNLPENLNISSIKVSSKY